jgi:hypothetical protein
VSGRRGVNTIMFTGALSRTKALAPGPYRLTATPTDSAHAVGRPSTVKLTILG